MHIRNRSQILLWRRKKKEREEDLGGAAVVRPRAPSGGVRVGEGVGEIRDASARSGDDALQELKHASSDLKRAGRWRKKARCQLGREKWNFLANE